MSTGLAYTERESFLHRADPRVKLLCVVVLLGLALSTTNMALLTALLLVVLPSVRFLGGVPHRTYLKLVGLFLPFIAVIALLQGLLQAGPDAVRVGPLGLSRTGLSLGAALGLRLLVMGLSFLALATTTSPPSLALGLHRLGIPYRFSYLTSFAFRFLPIIQEEARTLLIAMSVRASPDAASRNPQRRIRAIVRMLFPLIVGSLRRSTDIALAMELRGYRINARRTYVYDVAMRTSDYVLIGCLLMLVLLTSYLRLAVWPFSQ